MLILSHSKPAAMFVGPAEFDSLVERIEVLENLLDGLPAVAEYLADPAVAFDASPVFGRLHR